MRLLIVDDDTAVVDFFSQAAEQLDVETVDTATTGEEAMSRVVNGQYDLITLDIRMPGLSGLEILSMVRNMCPHAIIAIVSGHFPDEIPEETSHCADVMVEKPIKLDHLALLVDAARKVRAELDRVRSLDSFKDKQNA